MNHMTLTCHDERRRGTARERNFNGIDYVEVGADQISLCVHLFGDVPKDIDKTNVRVEGGRRVRDIRVIAVSSEREDDPELGECLRVTVDRPGDFSTYRLCLVETENGRPTDRPYPGFDPRYACVEFSFKVDCPSDLDCLTEPTCPPEKHSAPEINYLAKDYASFRQLLFDRLALLLPDWRERHVPDIGVALVEVLAYAADHLSYYQDAVATEAYLGTARERISVRRHARLVDYQMHDGCNARAFVFVETDDDWKLDPADIYFVTNCAELDRVGNTLQADVFNQLRIPSSSYDVFEPVAVPKCVSGMGDTESVTGWIDKLLDTKDQLAKQLRVCLSSNTQYLLVAWLATWDGRSALPAALHAALSDEWQRLHSGNIYLYEAHSRIDFYTWGNTECCLSSGATRATLLDAWEPTTATPGQPANAPEYKKSLQGQVAISHYKSSAPAQPKEPTKEPVEIVRNRKLKLAVGDVLIFEEVIGPQTDNPADADLAHRHAVRLTKVEPGVDPLGNQLIVEIEWAAADALPFPLCLSAVLPAPECSLVERISIARGNIVLVDHGRTSEPDPLDPVPVKTTIGDCECGTAEMSRTAGRFQPVLKQAPLTFSQPLEANLVASAMLTQDPRWSLPQITNLVGLPGVCLETGEADETGARGPVEGIDPNDPVWRWVPQRDLLSSQSADRHFVAETDNDGHAHLRFGDGELGRAPEACAKFTATYRVGNGTSGNVGADAITHLIFRQANLSGITPRNPLPAQGGIEPEPLSEVKLFASGAFRKDLQRAITADDYARLAERNQQAQRAAAELRWTGSWYEARVSIDPRGTEVADDKLLHEIAGQLHPYRRIGHDLTVVSAHYVPLEIELTVCVLPHHQRGHVKAALLEAFSNRVLSGGRRGFFHPDSLTFGSAVYLSKLVATAQAVEGVESVTVRKLQRRFDLPNGEIEDGLLPLGAMEVAQLDNDPSFPEHGKLTLTMEGGR